MNAQPARIRQRIGWVFWVFWLCVFAFGGTAAGWLGRSGIGGEIIKGIFFHRSPEETFRSDSVNLLVLGCDETRNNKDQIIKKYARSDMILVTHLDFKLRKVTGISIPRDTGVSIPGYDYHKINSYFDKGSDEAVKDFEGTKEEKLKRQLAGGSALAKQAVQNVLGVQIDRVIVLNFDSFKKMVDMVGGVTMYVDKQMDYDDNWGNLHIHLKPGKQKLSGEQANGFVRERKSDSDFKRQDRQKEFMVAYKDALTHHVEKLPDVLNEAMNLLNNGLNQQEVSSLIFFMKGVDKDNIKMGMLPVKENPGSTMLTVESDKLSKTLADFNFIAPPILTSDSFRN